MKKLILIIAIATVLVSVNSVSAQDSTKCPCKVTVHHAHTTRQPIVVNPAPVSVNVNINDTTVNRVIVQQPAAVAPIVQPHAEQEDNHSGSNSEAIILAIVALVALVVILMAGRGGAFSHNRNDNTVEVIDALGNNGGTYTNNGMRIRMNSPIPHTVQLRNGDQYHN